MPYKIMTELKQKLEKVVASLKNEVSSLRTGRATPALVEDLEVEYYGAKTPLKAVAAISSPEPRTLVIQPWDKAALQPIEKAIQSSSLGLNPVTDRDIIRLSIPQLTEERRKELVKTLGKYLEEARIRVRQERESVIKDLDRKEKAKEISEDEKFRQKNDTQKIVDEVNKKIEEIGEAKEKEIMTV
jgi:ribosome recycling factor